MHILRPSLRVSCWLAGAAIAFATTGTPAYAGPITFDFTSGPYGVGTTAPRVFSNGGVTVTATALSFYSGAFHPANLGKWDNGLAVCNALEMVNGCQSGEHQVTNNGEYDFVLFAFSGALDVIPLSARIRTTNGNDLDVTYWTGTGAIPTGITGGTNNESPGGSVRTVTLSSGVADWLLFGAQIGERNDGFKIKNLIVDTRERQVPEPASTVLLGIGGLAYLAGRRRCRT